jgi:hypothetical protein
MSGRAASLVRLLKALARDESGVILPYVTVMMIAIMGLATLALDAARYTSFQTQMQAAADALALAGARELDGSTGSRTRATNAINSMVANGLTGFGPDAPTPAAATIAFYSALPAASAGFGGTAATGDGDSKYVGVTLAPASVPTILPVPVVSNQLTTNAQAIAGYDFAVCNMPPVFICNPYETAGMDEATATQTLVTNLKDSTVTREQMLLTVNGGSGYGPGHFGFLMPPDLCTGANCLRDWIASSHPKACYRKKTVDLNTGQMQSVFDAFNVRFDMYSGSIKASADNRPALNVRKGYQASTNNWCNASAATPYLTTRSAQSSSIVTVTTTGTTGNGNNCNAKNSNNPCLLKVSHDDALAANAFLSAGNPHAIGPALASGATVASVCIDATSGDCPSYGVDTIKLSNPIAGTVSGAKFKIGWPTSGLPRDTAFSGFQGNGQWDCANYWAINHPGVALPSISGVCGSPSTTTMSRAAVYAYENTNSLINDFSFPGLSRTGVDSTDSPLDAPAGAENGAPKCSAYGGISTDQGGGDRRTIYAAAINCLAQSAKLNQGGQTANDVPVAGFIKFFLTEPVDTGNQTLIGEMTGAVGLDKNAKNNVQLYR